MNNERLLPHNVDAEECVIGSLLLQGDIKTIDLVPDDFYSDRNRNCFISCQLLTDRNVSINEVTLANELAERDQLESAGGAAYVVHLVAVTPTSLDMVYYADIVKKLSIKRQLISYSEKVADLGYNPGGELKEDFKKADDLLLNLRKHNTPIQIITPKERARMLNERYSKLSEMQGGIAIPTGLTDIDRWLGGGLMAGDFVIIGARTGVGKTTILQTIANNIGASKNVLYISIEMTTDNLSDRDVAGYLGEPVAHIRRGDYFNTNDVLIADIIMALEVYIEKLNVYHVSGPFSTDDIRQLALAMQVRYGMSAIMVDYLGILKDRYGNNDEQRLSYISRTLKQIAMEFNVPVISPHQLNRGLESREDKRPQLYDLRGSGSIEQDADIVLLMYRQNYYDRIKDSTTEVIIAKQRQGPSNKVVKVSFDQKHQRYCDYEKPENDIVYQEEMPV
jgi:replicative DNA helicase